MWKWIYSATDYVKQNTPDVTPVTEACRKGYDVGRATTTHIDGAVRCKARKLHEYISDDQVRANATRFATNVAKNGALYVARSYGVGPVIDVLQDSKADPQKERVQELETRVAKLERELNDRKILEQAPIPAASMQPKAGDKPDFNANLIRRPEEGEAQFKCWWTT